MNDVISNYVYREAISQQAQFAVGFPVLITIIIYIISAGMGIFACFTYKISTKRD